VCNGKKEESRRRGKTSAAVKKGRDRNLISRKKCARKKGEDSQIQFKEEGATAAIFRGCERKKYTKKKNRRKIEVKHTIQIV